MLNIRPIMGENGHGEIIPLEKVRGTANAMRRLVEIVASETAQAAGLTLVLSYCNCLERAQELKKMFLSQCSAIKEVIMFRRTAFLLFMPMTAALLSLFKRCKPTTVFLVWKGANCPMNEYVKEVAQQRMERTAQALEKIRWKRTALTVPPMFFHF